MVNRPLTKDEKKFNGAKIAFSKSVAGIDGHPPYKKNTKNVNTEHTLHKKQLKMDHKTKCKMKNYKTPRR